MKQSRLRAAIGMRYALLDPILEKLAREGMIRIEGDIITLLYLIVILSFKAMIIWLFTIISLKIHKAQIWALGEAKIEGRMFAKEKKDQGHGRTSLVGYGIPGLCYDIGANQINFGLD